MWILRFHKIETKDYNYIKRVFDKMWFSPKKNSGIIFVKALFLHTLYWKSWRKISEILDCNHILLFNFFNKYKFFSEIKEIFFYFAERKIIIYIPENIKNFSNFDLDENKLFLENTKKELKKILLF